MGKYSYSGAVTEFGTVIMNHWEAQTIAPSEKKARSNMAYQFKKKYNRTARSKIELPDKIILEE